MKPLHFARRLAVATSSKRGNTASGLYSSLALRTASSFSRLTSNQGGNPACGLRSSLTFRAVSSFSRHTGNQDNNNPGYGSLLIFGGALLACSVANSSINTTEAEKKNPKEQRTAASAELNKHLMISGMQEVEDASKDSGSDGCGCNKKEKDSAADKEDDDEDDSSGTPDYINTQVRRDLGRSLSRIDPIAPESRYLLQSEAQYPVVQADLTMAPEVPPPLNRHYPVHLVVDMVTVNKTMRVQGSKKYEFWPFGFYSYHDHIKKLNYGVPGPFIRARVGDILQVNHTNLDESGMAHSVDFHSVCGPGGGSPTTFAEQDETRTGAYRLMKPGLYVYHCAASPIPLHIHNGMFGLILVEPEEGLPPVDREFYVMQHEMYLTKSEDDEDDPNLLEHDYDAATKEIPSHIFFNGRENALVDKPLMANQDEVVRIFVGNAGPNILSSFHIIGTVFDKVYREGDLVSPPAKYVQTTLIPSGGVSVVELKMQVPGNFAIVDHSINRIDKGAVGFLKVKGKPRPDIYDSSEPPRYCAGCKTHN